MTPARILIIAGSDSGGGAGIQADIKTVTMLGGHAMTAITTITAQNTLGVQAIHPVPAEMVIAQIDAVVSDIGVDAIKIGMIGSAEIALAVAERLAALENIPILFDPVMVSTSGAMLADDEVIAAFRRLIGVSTLVTPNLPELATLGGEETMLAMTDAILVKGGHGKGRRLIDRLVLRDGGERTWQDDRIDTPHNHGTGCTLASAIATGLGQGMSLPDSIARARLFVRLALLEAPGIGGGHGPMGQQNVRLDCGDDMRLNQIAVPASDYAASRDFYARLGLTVIADSPDSDYARLGSPGGVTLSTYGVAPAIYFECTDLDARVAALTEAGFVFETLPVDQSWGWREAWLRDPAGNRVCLFAAGEYRRFPPWRIS